MSALKPKWAPKRLMDLIGREVITRRQMQNAYAAIPAGTRVRVDSATAWHKIHVVGLGCECCGVKPVMGGVHINDLGPLPIKDSTPNATTIAALEEADAMTLSNGDRQ